MYGAGGPAWHREHFTYVGHVGNVELSGLAEGETWDHGAAPDGPLIAPEFEFVSPDVENVIPDYERGTKHDE
jgi:hypothetical protein